MKRNTLYNSILIIFFSFFLLATTASAQVSYYGGKGLLRIMEAETIHPGVLAINPLYAFYGSGDNENFSEDHSLHLGATLSLSEQFEIFMQLTPYQDDQKHTWGPLGDSRLYVKYHLPRYGSMAQFGITAFTKFPTALNHNVPFEPYTDDAMGWGMVGLATFDFKDYIKTFPMKLSVNLGYLDNNWSDTYFSSEKDQIIGGLGFKFPIRSSLFYSELTGEMFLNNADITPSQNFTRFTQGFRFVGPMHLICDLAVDFELGRFTPETKNENINPYLKDYADWKIMFGVTYRTSIFSGKTRKEQEYETQRLEEKKELDQIQEKRKKVVKDLEDLRKQLEEEDQPKPE